MSKEQPFFSIVIPTKNRPDYLRQSIQSVLLQGFDDYELIISDNFNESPTERVLEEFRCHPKVKTYRTKEEMNMIDHWEFATKKTIGKYVILLADRKVLYKDALKTAEELIQEKPELNAYSFGVRMYDEVRGEVVSSLPFSGELEMLESAYLARNFLDENLYLSQTLDNKFPKTLNGCYKNSFAKEVRERIGAYFNYKGVMTPDFSSFCINVALNKYVGYLSAPLILTQGEHLSNGRNFGQGKVKGYLGSLKLDDLYCQVPIKAPFIYNLVFSDYLVIKQVLGGELDNVEINYVNYYAVNKYENNRKNGVTELAREVKQFFTDEWDKSFASLNQEMKDKIKQKVKDYEDALVQWNLGKRKHTLKDYLKSVQTKLLLIKFIRRIFVKRYPDGLRAAKFNSL